MTNDKKLIVSKNYENYLLVFVLNYFNNKDIGVVHDKDQDVVKKF